MFRSIKICLGSVLLLSAVNNAAYADRWADLVSDAASEDLRVNVKLGVTALKPIFSDNDIAIRETAVSFQEEHITRDLDFAVGVKAELEISKNILGLKLSHSSVESETSKTFSPNGDDIEVSWESGSQSADISITGTENLLYNETVKMSVTDALVTFRPQWQTAYGGLIGVGPSYLNFEQFSRFQDDQSGASKDDYVENMLNTKGFGLKTAVGGSVNLIEGRTLFGDDRWRIDLGASIENTLYMLDREWKVYERDGLTDAIDLGDYSSSKSKTFSLASEASANVQFKRTVGSGVLMLDLGSELSHFTNIGGWNMTVEDGGSTGPDGSLLLAGGSASLSYRLAF